MCMIIDITDLTDGPQVGSCSYGVAFVVLGTLL